MEESGGTREECGWKGNARAEKEGRKGKKREERRDEGGDERGGERESGRGRQKEKERTRGSNLPFSILKRRVYQDEESQEGIKGV